MNTRRSSAVHPDGFAHPYLNVPPPVPKKREFGLCNLFLFKMCGCFSTDNLPPPNYEAPIYQAGKSSSSNLTFNTNTTTTPTTSRTNSPGKDPPQSPTMSTSTTTNSHYSSTKPRFAGSTGVENIPYRRPPKQPPRSPSRPPRSATANYRNSHHTSPVPSPKSPPKSESSRLSQNPTAKRVSEAWLSRPPVELAESDEVEAGRIVGNVSRLSALFEQP